MSLKPSLSSDRTTCVDRQYKWLPINQDTPRGVKLQLINKLAGVATYGVLGSAPHDWTHWCPLPTFE